MKRTLLLLALFLVFFSGSRTKQTSRITIAVAANMKYAAQELIKEFEEKQDADVQVVIGASGNLTQQIMQGAPFHIFISADTSFPEKLYRQGFAAERPREYARGLLVLWTMDPALTLSADCRSLLTDQVRKIAIANPVTAPYGTAAKNLLEKYHLFERLQAKMVYGESITQTTQFIVTRAADAGFTAKSIVVSDEMSGKGHWIEMSSADYPAIKQSAVLLKYGLTDHAREAKKFFDFLFSDQAKSIFRKFGYILP